MNKEDLNKELLERMYLTEKKSIRTIAKELGATKGQIDYFINMYGIPTRSPTQAKEIFDNVQKSKTVEESATLIRERIKNFHINTKFSPVLHKNMLIPIPLNGNARDAVVTLVISDTHIGDANHLPECYWSSLDNAVEILKNINGLYKIKRINLVLNGDVVSGLNVYKYQELRNLIQRGHWQVFLAEIILKETLERIAQIGKVDEVVLVRGTHENLDQNFILYLKRIMPGNSKYLSHGGIYNIGGDLGESNVIFMHGYGYSQSCPVSYRMINDALKIVNMYKNEGLQVDRICSAHSHWLSSGFIVDDIYWDTTGGYQKWEYTINQRPCGMIIYLYSDGEVVSLPVRPDPIVEMKEKADAGLEYRNLTYYGNYLLKHLKEIEGID